MHSISSIEIGNMISLGFTELIILAGILLVGLGLIGGLALIVILVVRKAKR